MYMIALLLRWLIRANDPIAKYNQKKKDAFNREMEEYYREKARKAKAK